MEPITALLQAARAGDLNATNQLYERLYVQLRGVAHAQLRRAGVDRSASLLSTTSLLNESYLKLVATGELQASDAPHFLAYAARTMRSIVIDHIRGRQAEKRGGGLADTALTTNVLDAQHSSALEALKVHEALDELAAIDARLAQIVEMRYFAGLTESETAAALGLSTRTVQRDWEKARLFLAQALR